MRTATKNAQNEGWDLHILHIWVGNAQDNQNTQNALRDNDIQVGYTFQITETTSYYEYKFN